MSQRLGNLTRRLRKIEDGGDGAHHVLLLTEYDDGSYTTTGPDGTEQRGSYDELMALFPYSENDNVTVIIDDISEMTWDQDEG